MLFATWHASFQYLTKSWIFTSVILWGADNKIEKKATLSQKTRVISLELQNYF
jgi:ABC-type Zn uptake system ZnuABC Zn-binding protein ZnuA